MTESHPPEIELARYSESRDREVLERHLQRCSRCRGVLAYYGWVEGEIAALLESEADGVPIPDPNWRGVREQLGRAEDRARAKELALVAGAALAVCLMFGAPSALGRKAQAQGMPASGVVTAPAPVSVEHPVTSTSPGSEDGRISGSGQSREGGRTSLPFVPIPTPPTPQG